MCGARAASRATALHNQTLYGRDRRHAVRDVYCGAQAYTWSCTCRLLRKALPPRACTACRRGRYNVPSRKFLLHAQRDFTPRYTRRLFGGLHPLCGIGVTSVIEVTERPELCSERIAASRPEPGPLTKTSTWRRPWSMALRAADSAVTCAAYGVLLREPLKPCPPALPQESTFPLGSVSVTIVLLKVA